MSKPVLTYFDLPASRGEECRLALTLAGVDFVDDRVQFKDWGARKDSTPFGSMPTLTIDGKGRFAQSNAILTLIGTLHGLRPSDPFAAAHHDAVMEFVEEMRVKTWDVLRQGSTDDEKKSIRGEFASGQVQAWGAMLSSQLKGRFVCGDEIQVADLKVWSVAQWFTGGSIDHFPADVWARHEKLVALHQAVGAHPKVQAFRALHKAA